MAHRIARIAALLLSLLFALAAALQFDDPDAALWIAVYGSGALCCGLFAAGRLPVWLGTLVSGACAAGALYLLARDVLPIGFLDPSGREMVGVREPGREMLGLILVALATGLLTWWAGTRRPPSSGTRPSGNASTTPVAERKGETGSPPHA